MTTSKATPENKRISLEERLKQRRAALPQEIPFEAFGVEFTFPPMQSLPIDVQERATNRDISVLRLALGDDKVNEMIKADFTVGDMELIVEEWQERSGTTPGESKAS
jgi:hypothetical protein